VSFSKTLLKFLKNSLVRIFSQIALEAILGLQHETMKAAYIQTRKRLYNLYNTNVNTGKNKKGEREGARNK
jgi:hypothetical protein